MNRVDTVDMLRNERAELSEFLTSLEADDWGRPTLCDDWSVLEVTAHLASAVGVTRRGLMARALRYGTGTDGANARSARAWAAQGPAALTEALADERLLGLGFFQPRWALCETVVHHQDIRRGLDRPRTIPADRLRTTLDVLLRMPFLTGASKAQRRITLIATDIDWRWGEGPTLSGPAEALMMAVAGRTEALSDLSGEARQLLA